MDKGRSQGFTVSSVPEAYDLYMAQQLFEPWAKEIVGRANLLQGNSVLDVACGPGPVARLAAKAVGPDGRVVASDISKAMLDVAVAKPVDSTSAPIEYLECSVTEIKTAKESFDSMLCQQGLQFFPDRLNAIKEMCRVARPGGIVMAATWASEHPLGLIGPMTEVMKEVGLEEPFPKAFDSQSYCFSEGQLRELFIEANLRDVIVETVELDAVWQDITVAVATLMGTPYGPIVAALPTQSQEQVRTLFTKRLGQGADGTVTVKTTSHIGRGVK